MAASMKVDMRGLMALIQRFDSPALRNELESIPQAKGVAAIISQAIADNFDKEGPGWAPLKGETLRRSVAKGVLRVAQMRAADDMNAISTSKKTNGQTINRKRLKGRMEEFHARTGKELAKIEASARTPKAKAAGVVPNRMILQKTGLLKKAATTAGFTGSSKSGNKTNTASNIYSVQGSTITWGVRLIYAKKQQEGDPSSNLPARPYLVLRKEWMARINEFVVDKIVAAVQRAIGKR